MEQKRVPIDEAAIDAAISRMRTRGTYLEPVYGIVREDMRLGITREETKLYTDKNYDIRQVRVCSNCLRQGYGKEVIDLICNSGFDASQMETVYGMVTAGLELDKVRQIIKESGGESHRMKKMFDAINQQAEEKEHADGGNGEASVDERTAGMPDDVMPGYLKEVLDSLKTATEKLGEQEDKYEALSEKLTAYEKSRDDEAVRAGMQREMEEKDMLLAKQQDELQQAKSALSRLRKEKENMEQEMRTMRNQMQDEIDGLSRRLKKQEMDARIDRSDTATQERTENAQEEEKTGTMTDVQPVGIPVYYQVPVVDSSGQIVQRVQVERSVRKTSGVVGVLGKLVFKKKSRADIVKLVAAGDLVPAQLVQIKSAIEKGLTEGQLVELINNNVSAEKMKEIIEIAVLENSMS